MDTSRCCRGAWEPGYGQSGLYPRSRGLSTLLATRAISEIYYSTS
jgi:hypothetical protein